MNENDYLLTNELLIENGYQTNHPEYVLCRLYKHSHKDCDIEWNINIEQSYITASNKLVYDISCWITNDKGFICRRASVSGATTVKDLHDCLSLCGINDEKISIK